MIDKATLRREARILRRDLQRRFPDAGLQLIQHFMSGPLHSWQGTTKPVIAGYWPHGSEIDVRPLMSRLCGEGYRVALPVSVAASVPLLFRSWLPDMVLMPDAMGMSAPAATAPILTPDMLIIPALAFDCAGHRLGSGTGCYDATLATLRAEKSLIATIAAFAGQQVATVFSEPHDQATDWILTETNARLIKSLLTKD